MAQTPATRRQENDHIDYTPGSDVTAGAVVVLGTALVAIAEVDIAANEKGSLALRGGFNVPKDASDVAQGAALYWDADGSPVGGTALSGAATTTSTGNPFMGFALEAAGTGVGDIDCDLRSADSTTISGDLSRMPSATVAVGGTAIGNANAVSTGFTKVTGANNSAAVKLPTAAAGKVCILKSSTSGSTLQVFPFVGDKINGAAANAVYNMANLSQRVFVAYDDTDWYTDPETPT